MVNSSAVRFILVPLLLPLAVLARQKPAGSSGGISSQKTLFVNVNCQEKDTPRRVLGPVAISEGGEWRAYVEVDVGSNRGCVNTTRLWVSRSHSPYRLLYMMPPKRTAQGNGMEILGWAGNSSMLLVLTEEWQVGSDAPDTQRVLAIDAGTGMVYKPELRAMLDAHKNKQCMFRVTDAGFSSGRNVNVLVRARFSTWFDVDETLEEVPPSKRCEIPQETWSFNYANGEIMRVSNEQPLHIFKEFLPNPHDR